MLCPLLQPPSPPLLLLLLLLLLLEVLPSALAGLPLLLLLANWLWVASAALLVA